jgi:predicted house-cleaning NTP pyrophosphatase (Maf/HAM1 superfamily)
MSVPPTPPLVLASTSPQRSAILHQLGIPFDAVAPDYEELGDDPLEHAVGKARSVEIVDERPVLGVDTIVRCDGRVLGKPADPGEAEQML